MKTSVTPCRPYDRLPGTASDSASADSYAWTRPEPITVAGTGPVPSLFNSSWVAWFMISALIRAGDQVGCNCRSSVATPETCGAAIEVPESAMPSVPVATAAEMMSPPGAETSGFSALETRAGPSDVKSVMRSSKPGITDGVAFDA